MPSSNIIIVFYIFLVAFIYFNSTTLNLVLVTLFLFSVTFVGTRILKNWHHVIIILLLMEMAILHVFLGVVGATIIRVRPPLIFLFSRLMVVEACAGMSLLALLTRTHGNDYMLVF
jgi:hypothetical protein